MRKSEWFFIIKPCYCHPGSCYCHPGFSPGSSFINYGSQPTLGWHRTAYCL